MTVENRKILIIEDNKDELRALVSHFSRKNETYFPYTVSTNLVYPCYAYCIIAF